MMNNLYLLTYRDDNGDSADALIAAPNPEDAFTIWSEDNPYAIELSPLVKTDDDPAVDDLKIFQVPTTIPANPQALSWHGDVPLVGYVEYL